MIGIVVVSHSHALASAALGLALEMVTEAPPIEIAAGLDESTFGTDAMAIYEAIERLGEGDGVLVLLDLGSAVLSAEMALEMLDESIAAKVKLSAAPLVEGLISAVVTASTGADLATVAQEASEGLAQKRSHLGDDEPEAPSLEEPLATSSDGEPEITVEFRHIIENPHGLHARPAATLVSRLADIDACVQLSNATRGKGPVQASSMTRVATLDLRKGDELLAQISGHDAESALTAMRELADDHFGEEPDEPVVESTPGEDQPLPASGQQIVLGQAWPVNDLVDTSGYQPQDPPQELLRFDAAVQAVGDHLDVLGQENPDQSGIFAAQAAFLADHDWQSSAHCLIQNNASAVGATHSVLAKVATEFDEMSDPYLRERAGDIRSLERMMLSSLTDADMEGKPAPEDAVWIINELDAATASSLSPKNCRGVITVSGGNTGHGVMVASARGIPCLTGREEAAQIKARTQIAFDPLSGELWVDPSVDELAMLHERAAERRHLEETASELADQPACTRSGRFIKVEANVASLDDARAGGAAKAQGAGLVRTEILFAAVELS